MHHPSEIIFHRLGWAGGQGQQGQDLAVGGQMHGDIGRAGVEQPQAQLGGDGCLHHGAGARTSAGADEEDGDGAKAHAKL